MARKQSKAAKKRTHKRRQSRRQGGGGWGFEGPSSAPGTPGTVSNPMVYTGIGDCRAVKPGYDIPYSSYGASFKGLPGMSGGKRNTRKGMKGKRTRKHRQRGGRYGFFPQGDPNASGQAWWAGSYAPIQRIACEGGSFNPLNPTHTGSSAPPGAANPNYWMKGGGSQMAPATYGVGNVDSMYYYAPTGGYANNASTWKDSVGAPVQIQVPYAARAMNQACLTTGGAPPLTGALQKGGKQKRTRKQRGGEGIWNMVKTAPGKATGALASVPFLGSLFGNGNTEQPVVVAEEAILGPNRAVGVEEIVAPLAVNGANGKAPNRANAPNPANTPNPATPVIAGGRRRKHKTSKSRKHKGGKH
jgi:hypothetical protein